MDEFGLIERYFAPLGEVEADDVLLGIGDDAAVLEAGDGRLVVAVDTLVADVHFPRDTPPEDIGYRVVAVNLSDLAAMAAEPRFATLALTLPAADAGWLERFARGFGEACGEHGVVLVGGDTTRGPLTVTVQLIGRLAHAPLTRGGGAPGDVLAVSGTLGDGAGALACAPDKADTAAARYLLARFRRPSARVSLARALRACAHAAIDVSDGLLADVRHLAGRSGCGADVERERLPLSEQLVSLFGRERALDLALGGGDDYELVFAIPPAAMGEATSAARELGIPLTTVGTLRPGAGVRLLDRQGRALEGTPAGYRHFA